MMMINALKPTYSYKHGNLNKNCRVFDKITFKSFDYELESYINIWLDKNHFDKLEFNLNRIENESEIIIIFEKNGLSKSLIISKKKLKEVKA